MIAHPSAVLSCQTRIDVRAGLESNIKLTELAMEQCEYGQEWYKHVQTGRYTRWIPRLATK